MRRGRAGKGNVMGERTLEDMRAELYDLMGRFHRERYMPADVFCGLTRGEMQVIRCVGLAAEQGESLRPSEMARRFGITPSAVSQSVKKLQEQGYLRRERLDADSRAVALVLTDKGAELAERGRAAHRAFMDDLFAFVGAENIESLIATLKLVLEFCETSPSVRRCDEGEGPCA